MTALYRHFNAVGELLYVGISISAMKRLAEHEKSSHWFSEIRIVTIEHFQNRKAALKAEKIAIRREKPKYNYGNIPDVSRHYIEYLFELRDDAPPGFEVGESGGIVMNEDNPFKELKWND